MIVGDMLIRSSNKFPKKTAVVSEDLSLTFQELNTRVNRLANGLLGMGINKGDRIGVLVHNCHQFMEIFFAAAKTGAVFCPYNNHLKHTEMKDIINYSQPRFLIFDSDFEELIKAIMPELDSPEQYVCLQKLESPQFKSYEDLVNSSGDTEPMVSVMEDDVMSMLFTAGTTGRPKGAMRTHRHLISDAVASAIELQVSYDERVLITFPMYHVAFEDNLVRHSFMPNTFYIKREGGFKPENVLEYISRERITRCQFVPTMIHRLIQVPDIEKYDLSSLQMILYAAAPMPVELLKKAMNVFSCGFTQMYGQTESGPVTTLLKPEDHILGGSQKRLERLASSGQAAINYEIRIVDDDDMDVPIGQVGEIIGRSEAMMKEYWQMPEETASKLRNGWLHTGDLGRMDEDGYVYIVERKNDMIISGGMNVYPREVEEVLYTHPAISEASVVGLPDDQWGEIVKAVIVLNEGAEVTESEIISYCGERLAGFKKPKSVDFWESLPKSSTGKILKRDIRKKYGA